MLKGVVALLLVAALTIVNGASIRDERCTLGPDWWCENEENALICDATKYCTEHVWETKVEETKVEETNVEVPMKCALCEYVVTAILKELEKGTSMDEILSLLEKVCEKIPVVGEQCASYVKVYGPYIISMLEEMVSADTICETLHLCSPALERFHKDNKLVVYLTSTDVLTGEDQCSMCKDGLSEVKDVLKDKNMLDVIETLITLFCNTFPMPQCQSLMEGYTKKYIEAIESWDVNEECKTLGACRGLSVPIPAPVSVPKVFDDECDACMDGMDEIKSILMDKEMVDLLKIAAEEMCKVVSVPLCPTLADTLIKQAIAAVENLEPKAICTQVGACKATIETVLPAFVPPAEVTSLAVPLEGDACDACMAGFDEIRSLLIADDTIKLLKIAVHDMCPLANTSVCEEILDMIIDNIIGDIKVMRPKGICQTIGACTLAKAYTVETVECDACMDGLDEIKTILLADDTQSLIKIAVKEICVLLSVPASTCTLVTSMVLPELIEKIKALDPKTLCVQFGACPAALGAVKDDSFTCEYCKFVGGKIIKRLDNNETDTTILEAARKVCSALQFPSLSDQCLSIVNQYGKFYIDELRDNINVNVICQTLNLCDPIIKELVENLGLVKYLTNEEYTVGTSGCDACVAGIDEIKNIITADDTKVLVEIAVAELCTVLGVPSCKEIGDLIISQLLAKASSIDGKSACVTFGACPADLGSVNDDSFSCEYCEFLGNEAMKRIFNNDTEALIVDMTKKVCATLPSMIGTECVAIVEEYGSYYLDELRKTLDVEATCQKFKLCDPSLKEFVESINEFVETLDITKVLTDEVPLQSDGCDACVAGFNDIKRILTDDNIVTLLKISSHQLCGLANSSVCEEILNLLIDNIIGDLKALRPMGICQDIGSCPLTTDGSELEYFSRIQSMPCMVCKMAGNEIKEKLLADETITKVLAIAHKGCSYLPFISEECTDFIAQDGVDLIHKLVAYINVDMICSKLQLCSSVSLEEDLPSKSFICDTCEFFGHEFVDRLLAEKTRIATLVIAHKACYYMPLYSVECQNFIDNEGKYFLDLWVSKMDTDSLCGKLKLCSPKCEMGDGTSDIEHLNENNVEGDGCDACVAGFNDIKALFTDDDTVSLLKIGTHELCGLANSSICEEILNLLIDNIIVDLKALRPEGMCQDIGACPLTQDGSDFQKFDLRQTFPCDTCKFIGHEIINRLLTATAITKVVSVAHKGCSYLPLISEECAEFIEKDGEELLHKFVAYINVDKVCSKIKLCSPVNLEQELGSKTFICDTCEFFGHEFVDRLLANGTRVATLRVAHKACSYMPLYSAECQNFIDNSGKYYLDLWVSNMDTDNLCRKLTLCPHKCEMRDETPDTTSLIVNDVPDEDLDHAIPPQLEGFVCDTCEFFGHEFVERLLGNKTRNATLKIAHRVCSYVPLYSVECHKFIASDGHYFLDLWISMINTDGLCGKLGLCTPEFETWYKTSSIPQLVKGVSNCDTCVEGFDELKKILNDAHTKDLIVVGVRQACVSLPIPFCNSVMNRIVNNVVESIGAINSKEECVKLGACTSREEDPVIVPATVEISVCDTCLEGIDGVKTVLSDPDTRIVLKAVVGEICTSLPIPMCEYIFGSYLDSFLDKVGTLDANETCQMFGLCSAESIINEEEMLQSMISTLPFGSDSCDMCCEKLDDVKKMLTDPEVIDVIKKAVDGICSPLPIVGHKCKETLHAYVDGAVQAILKLNSKNTCAIFGIC